MKTRTYTAATPERYTAVATQLAAARRTHAALVAFEANPVIGNIRAVRDAFRDWTAAGFPRAEFYPAVPLLRPEYGDVALRVARECLRNPRTLATVLENFSSLVLHLESFLRISETVAEAEARFDSHDDAHRTWAVGVLSNEFRAGRYEDR